MKTKHKSEMGSQSIDNQGGGAPNSTDRIQKIKTVSRKPFKTTAFVIHQKKKTIMTTDVYK